MILITSFGEFLLYFIVIFFIFFLFHIYKKKTQCCRIVVGACPVLLQRVSSSGLEFLNQG